MLVIEYQNNLIANQNTFYIESQQNYKDRFACLKERPKINKQPNRCRVAGDNPEAFRVIAKLPKS